MVAYTGLDAPAKEIFWGNLMLVACCAFYLAWWIVAFQPAGAIRGMRSGWLLIPAVAAGLAAVILILHGISSGTTRAALFPGHSVIWVGIAAYIILFLLTLYLLKRPVTTELFLIVGWTVLALSELNALYGMGRFSHPTSVALVVVVIAAAAVSLICYIIYYKLNGTAGYFVGMVPLILLASVMGVISVRMAV